MLFICCVLNGQTLYANLSLKDQTQPSNTSQGMLKQSTPEFLYSYIDFNFDSTTDIGFNRFQGHSNLYSAGADHLVFTPSINAGIYIFRVDTELNSQFSIAPNNVTPSYQTIRNNTLFGHIRKSLNQQFSLDLAGGYGQNHVSSQSWILPNTPEQAQAFGNYHNKNWFTSFNALYKKKHNKLSLKASVGILYSQINTGSYVLLIQPAQPLQTVPTVPPLTNKVTYIMESAELGYNINSVFSPFINGGLIQVAHFQNSRPVFVTPVNGSLPQLNMNKNGFKLGGGLTFIHKQFTLRLEEKYYNAGNTFRSYQTVAGLEYRFA